MKGLFQCPPWARSFCPFRAYWVISTVQVEIIPSKSPQCPIHGRCGDLLSPSCHKAQTTREKRTQAHKMRNMLIDNNLNVSENRNLSKFSKTFSFLPDYQRLNIF